VLLCLLFTLLAETGIRINEALNIYVEDIVLSAGQEGIRFRGKGEYEREIPLPFKFESLKLLRAYLRNEDLTAGPPGMDAFARRKTRLR
jgi:site-specific recombinase XerD